jgi:Niemann-Pick C1 protein
VLAFAPSTIFRLYYFRMYLALIVVGLWYGLVALPIALSYFGPDFVNLRVIIFFSHLMLEKFLKEDRTSD